MECCNTIGIIGSHADYCNNTPLAPWEKELLLGTHEIGEGEVSFYVKGGGVLTIDHLRIDSISGIASNAGVITAELFSDENKMYHIPNVLYWMVDYRF